MRHRLLRNFLILAFALLLTSSTGCTTAILTDPGQSGASEEVDTSTVIEDRDQGHSTDTVPRTDPDVQKDVTPAPDILVEDVRPPGPDLSFWTYESGEKILGPTGYIEFIPGDTAVIITAPHGGYVEPADIPDRTGTTVRDMRTQELARETAEAFYQATGKRPHIVINLLARVKLDANREIVEAAEGHPAAEAAWHEYHAFIEEAAAYITARYGRGLYLDIHGHAHAEQRVELGYMVSATNLRRDDETLNSGDYARQSSIRTLHEDNAAHTSFTDLLRGPASFGALLETQGFPSVPSADKPAPEEGWAFFSGGYNTGRHGSRDGGPISGIQLEVNRNVRVDDVERRRFADALVASTLDYLDAHYGIDHRQP